MDDDDFAVVVRAAPDVAVEAAPAPAHVQAPRAEVVHLESFAFNRAYLAFDGAAVRKKAPPKQAEAPLDDVALGRVEDGPWAQLKTEQEDIRLVSGKRVDNAADATAAKPEKDEPKKEVKSLPPMSVSKTEYLGPKLVDYQNRRFCDVRRMPTSIIAYDDGEAASSDEEVEEIDKRAAKMLGLRKKGRAAQKKDAVPSKLLREHPPVSMGLHRVRVWRSLALTAGLDGSVLVWDASWPGDVMGATAGGLANEGGAIQSYYGHAGESVKDCWFRSDGQQFASAGYDGCVVLWDTDTGRELSRFRGASGAMNAVRLRPGDETSLLAACGDRKLRHWDVRQPPDKPAQTYDYHQANTVHAVTFCDLGRRFVSTGEDRQLLVWDWAVPAPIKIVSETWMPSIPALCAHPSSFLVASVGMDSRIGQWRISRRTGKFMRANDISTKDYKAAGFACEPCYSPDGDFLACGDGDQGGIYIWRVKQRKGADAVNVSRIEGAHAMGSPVASVFWHPCFEGVLMSAGWDGKLKMWGV